VSEEEVVIVVIEFHLAIRVKREAVKPKATGKRPRIDGLTVVPVLVVSVQQILACDWWIFGFAMLNDRECGPGALKNIERLAALGVDKTSTS
jgi:hypothetical protein